jgi:hypothetical protein
VARRLSGTDPAEIRDAFGALFRVHSPADVRRLVDRVLAEVSLTPGCLVKLAGCRTAHQAARPGPLITGLAPAFLAGGAGHVLAALWPLDDEAAMTFQTAFYRGLARDGHPPTALARCRRLAGKGALGEAVRAPEASAGYVLYGI